MEKVLHFFKNLFRDDDSLGRKILFAATIIYTVIYLFWRITTTFPFQYGIIAVLCSLILLICELSSIYEAGVRYAIYTKEEPLEAPVIPDDMYPDVDILVTVHSEEVDLLYTTLNACTFLDYPDKSKVHVWLCDDACRDEMKNLAEELDVGYFAAANNKHMKAGNMNYALERTSSPLVVTLDADMIPLSNFLKECVPYFFLPYMEKDEEGNWNFKSDEEAEKAQKVGFLQTPQSFYNESVLNYNLGIEHDLVEEQELFFKAINPARNSLNASHYCGSNVILSREGLEEIGGFPTETITEDYHATIKLEKAGYRTYAIPKTYCQGLSPSTISSLIKQRDRWAAGNVAVWREEAPVLTSPDLTISQKIGQAASLIYWLGFPRKIVFLLVPILTLIFGIIMLDGSWIGFVTIWAPFYLLYYFTQRTIAGKIWKPKWSSVVDTILAPFLTLSVFNELRGKRGGFVVTDKEALETRSFKHLRFAVPHIILFVLSFVALIVGIHLVFVQQMTFFAIALGWLLYNVLSLAVAIKFMYGRDNKRRAFRFFENINSKIITSDQKDGQAIDLSKTGIGVVFDEPLDSKEKGDGLTFTICDHGYEAHLNGTIVNAYQKKEKWYYGILLDKFETKSNEKRNYYQLVFDREHSLPKETNSKLSLLKIIFRKVA